MSLAPVVVWFRQDLRLADNPALAAAVASGRPVVPLFILSDAPDGRPWGGASAWWLDRSLAALAADLEALGSGLVLRRGDPAVGVAQFAAQIGAAGVVWNRLYGGQAVARDANVLAQLRAAGVQADSYNAGLLIEPWALRTGQGGAYQVFTPFWRAARAAIGSVTVGPPPSRLRAPADWPVSDRLSDWGLQPSAPDWSQGFRDWVPGEAGAQARLSDFLGGPLAHYAQARDRPDVDGTTRLSPHLHWGEIGPRQVWAAALQAAEAGQGSDAQVDKLLAELGWREFNHHLLFARPHLARVNVRPAFDAFPWRADPAGLEAWRRGRTGYPLVDAGMRQLWSTGWMHNRVRMVAASFLVKHLLIDWRQGEQWFWDTLVDADEANNPASWQWVAGSGADAAPFFRIFNPVLQGERFDPRGAYVRRWVPELGSLPDRYIHQPWTAPPLVLRGAGIDLGGAYPLPIVEHGFARARALAALKATGGQPDIDAGSVGA